MQTMNLESLRKIIFVSIFAGFIAACATPEMTPAPQKLERNVLAVPSTTIMQVTAQNSYPAPGNEAMEAQSGRFKVIYDIYDENDNHVLVPAGAIINGQYTNDGTSCRVDWKYIYAYNDETQDPSNAVALDKVTKPTACKASRGIENGDRLDIKFTELKK